MKEDFLHFLWKYKKIPSHNLKLTTGTSLCILNFGQYNHLEGADFFNAQIKIGEQIWAGNVEMHLRSSHWYAHGHEKDKAYNNVILHVVWQHDTEVFNQIEHPIPTLELQPYVESHWLEEYEKLLKHSYQFINCEKQISTIENIFLEHWKERLFVERLQEKSEIIYHWLSKNNNDWEAVLFQLLAKNFGTRINGDAFTALAESLPFSIVRKERTNKLHLEALFMGQCGLLNNMDIHDSYYIELQKIYQYLKVKYQLQPSSFPVRFFKLRPPNFPTIRLSQLAQLYEKMAQVFTKFICVKTLSELNELFGTKASDYWDTHYTFGKDSHKRSKKISKSLLELIFINTLIPLQYVYARSQGREISEALIEQMREISPEKNSIIENYQKLKLDINSAFDTQSLLQLYKLHCKKNACLQCDIGIQLLMKSTKV